MDPAEITVLGATNTITAHDISVVVCAYTVERWDALQRAVDSVLTQTAAPSEVIVVIDHNPDLLALAQQHWSASRVAVVPSDGPPGLSGARNTGVASARGAVVAFLDDDAEAEPDWLGALAASYDESVVAVGGRIDPAFGAPRPHWWPPEFDWVVGCSYRGLPEEPSDVRNVIGANMSMRRDAVRASGGFASDLGRVGRVPLGCEETELCIRLQRDEPHRRVRYEPAARVRHHVPASRLTPGYFLRRCYGEGISKARVAARVGQDSALSSERNHLTRTLLPAVVGPRGGGPSRRLAVVLGTLAAGLGMASGVLARLKSDALGVATGSLVVNTTLTSLLGLVFWALAARRFPVAELGVDAALVGAMILLSSIAQLNLGNGLQRLLPQFAEKRWRPVAAAYAAAAAASVISVAVFVVLIVAFDGYQFLHGDGAALALLVPAVALWSVFALQDAVLVSTRWAPVVPLENAVFGVVKIVLMVAFTGAGLDHAVFLAWVVGMAMLVVPMNVIVFGVALRRRHGIRASQDAVLPIKERRRVGRFLALDYAAALLSQGSTALLPLLVVGILGEAANGYFYVAFLIATALIGAANGAASAVVAEGGHDEARVAHLVARASRYFLAVAAPAVAVLVAVAPLVLSLFGTGYATNASTVLRLLVLGVLPQSYVTLAVAAERVRGDARRVIRIEAATVVVVLASSIVGMRLAGLDGLGWAWLAANSLLALTVSPLVFRRRRLTVSAA